MRSWIRSHPRKVVLLLVGGVILGYVGYQAVASVRAFNRIASEEFDPAEAAQAMQEPAPTTTVVVNGPEEAPTVPAPRYERLEAERLMESRDLEQGDSFSVPYAVSPPLPDDMFESILLIGSDASGLLADVIIDVLLPADGSNPIVFSIPRDLYLLDECDGGYSRVNAALGGCRGVASGPELLALTVQRFTGIEVDHYVRVDFDGFKTVIDRMGGVTICVGDTPVRDVKAHLEIGAGCHHVGGETALAWVRSRSPEKLIDGQWVAVGGSDFLRQRRQQDLLFQLADKLASYSTVASLASALENLASAVRMDSGWSIWEVAQLGFRYRGLDRDDVIRLSIPTEDYRTGAGAQVLLPTESFNRVLGEVYPPARLTP